METDKAKVIWESEHACGTRFRIVRRQVVSSAQALIEHKLEESAHDEVDAMGVRSWHGSSIFSTAIVEALLAALLRELPK